MNTAEKNSQNNCVCNICTVIFLVVIMNISGNFTEDVQSFETALGYGRSFDIVCRTLRINSRDLKMYFVNGMVINEISTKIVGDLCAETETAPQFFLNAQSFADRFIPFAETGLCDNFEDAVTFVLSGQAAIIVDGFDKIITADIRSYPAREPQEPENNRVLIGPHEGFSESLIMNTTLLRRRLRDPSLTITLMQLGKKSKLDIAVCYFDGRVDQNTLSKVMSKLQKINVDTICMSPEGILECLVSGHSFNPFPRVRYTERPDSAAASVAEGSIIIISDNSPAAMIIPTSFFDFLQDTNDFYFPAFLGSFLRLVRLTVFSSTLFLTPVWYLLIKNPEIIPDRLSFIKIEEAVGVPVFVQLILIELVIDTLKLASLNTPNSLSNSFSVISALVLGEFAVNAKWMTSEVVLYMAFVAIANFTQPSFELGHAYKLCRVFVLILTALFNYVGFAVGYILVFVLAASTKTVSGRSYLYPLFPFNFRALKRLILRESINRKNN